MGIDVSIKTEYDHVRRNLPQSPILDNNRTKHSMFLGNGPIKAQTFVMENQKPKSMVKSRKNEGTSPWPSAKEYAEIFKRFLTSRESFETYRTEDLGCCKLTGTPLQPEWLYTNPKPGIYFLECEKLRGKGSFGFPKCETLRRKSFEWKKTSYVNNVPKAKPIISYITANGHGSFPDGTLSAFRMRIIKPINLECENAGEAEMWVLVDIHVSEGLARRNGPRAKSSGADGIKQPLSLQARNNCAANRKRSMSCPDVQKIMKNKSQGNYVDGLTLNTQGVTQQMPHIVNMSRGDTVVPLSPMKRLSLLPSSNGNGMASHHAIGSPKGKKMQRVSQCNQAPGKPTDFETIQFNNNNNNNNDHHEEQERETYPVQTPMQKFYHSKQRDLLNHSRALAQGIVPDYNEMNPPTPPQLKNQQPMFPSQNN